MPEATLGTSFAVPRRQVHRPVNRTAERIFFGGTAALLCAIVFIGFSPTWFQAGLLSAPLPSQVVRVHGVVFTTWMLLYFTQTALISANRIAWHRTFGTIAFCLVPVMIVMGFMAAMNAFSRKTSIAGLDPAASQAFPLLDIGKFAVLIFAAWQTRRRPDAHKRLILFATIALSEAALGRFPWTQMGVSPAVGPPVSLAVLILLVVAWDLFSLHRVHRTTMWAAPFTFLLGVLIVPIGMTPVWHSFIALLARIFL
jgi:hypothetical protein